jgi:hypothetical protein
MSRQVIAPNYRNCCTKPSRRDVLSIGATGLLGLTMPKLLAAEGEKAGASDGKAAPRARAKAVIFLFQFGGPTHIDTLDMKPLAPEGIRGPFRSIETSVPGLRICEHLPRVAKVMDKVTLVRSVHHSMKNHNSAAYYALTGHAPPLDDIRLRDSLDLYPAYGSVVDRLAPAAGGLPTFAAFPHVIRDGAITPGQHASFLGKVNDPLLITEDPADPNFRLPELRLPANLSVERLHNRREIQALIDAQSKLLDTSAKARGMDAYYEKVLSMLSSPRVRQAFDLSAEPPKLRDAYGRTTYGQSLLLARRLVEAGVKFVNVYFDDTIGGQSTSDGGWDTHGFNNTRMYPILQKRHLPLTDQTLPTFLADLDARGLLDETLVIWMGEFGRTPKINDNISRDHWPACYTVLLAGGGVQRGHLHGASDKHGAYPDRDPVRLDDLSATMFHLLGINPETEVRDTAGRPLAIAEGKVVEGVIG